MMKAYKTLRGAIQASEYGRVIIDVGGLFIVGGTERTEVEILRQNDLTGIRHITGSVTVRHLERLGNANHAVQIKR